MRLVIGGSAGNPSHRAHLAIAQAMLASGRFDRVVWDICGARWDKPGLASPDHRMAMAERTFTAIRTDPRFTLRMEDTHGPFTPTVHFLERFARLHPDDDIAWYTGFDVLCPQERFEGRCEIVARWIDGERLLGMFPIIVIPRQGYPHPSAFDLPPRCEILDVPVPDISSTEIRRRVAAGEPIGQIVTPDVHAYIRTHGLYRSQ